MTKARLIYLLVFAALLAFYAGGFLRLCLRPLGMNDGGWID
jgi:hypothetical protein